MSTHFLTPEQVSKLRRLARRVKTPYVAKIVHTPGAGHYFPGLVSVTARNWKVYVRLVNLIKRIVPEFCGELKPEHGTGWHYGDRTPYYFSQLCYFTK